MSVAKTIHVALASDENYFEGLLTTAWTIVRNCSRPQSIIFHILDGGISKSSFDYLQHRICRWGAQINSHYIDQDDNFGSFKAYHGSGRMTYARLLLPDLLPHISHIIYTDVDIIWVADIAELWDSLDPTAVIHYVPSQHTIKAELDWFANHNLSFEYGNRFCAGMIAINLTKFRQEKLHIKMLDAIVSSNGDVPCVDETVLNAFTFWRKDRQFLDGRWQHMSFGRKEPLEPKGFTLHFGTDAPWQSIHKYHHLLTDQHLIWHRFHAEARQISTWKSLRMPNGPFDIIACRTIFLLARYLPPVRAALRLALILRGKKQNLASLDLYMQPFDIRKVDRRLLP